MSASTWKRNLYGRNENIAARVANIYVNKTQLLVLSSHNNASNVKKSFQHGAIDYIVKPYTPEDLLNRLAFHLQKTRAVKTIKDKDIHKALQRPQQILQKERSKGIGTAGLFDNDTQEGKQMRNHIGGYI